MAKKEKIVLELRDVVGILRKKEIEKNFSEITCNFEIAQIGQFVADSFGKIFPLF